MCPKVLSAWFSLPSRCLTFQVGSRVQTQVLMCSKHFTNWAIFPAPRIGDWGAARGGALTQTRGSTTSKEKNPSSWKEFGHRGQVMVCVGFSRLLLQPVWHLSFQPIFLSSCPAHQSTGMTDIHCIQLFTWDLGIKLCSSDLSLPQTTSSRRFIATQLITSPYQKLICVCVIYMYLIY